MKPTDDKRREVASRLRLLEPRVFKDGELYRTWDVLDALGVEVSVAWFKAASVRRLADLIEPPLQCPYYDSAKYWCGVHDAPAIDRDALLDLADAMDEEADKAGLDASRWRVAARIVREACGADDGE